MTSLADLTAASSAFADLAERVDPDAAVRSRIWPNAGELIDHLGSIQGWAAQVVRTGQPADRALYRRPDDAARDEWFRSTSDALIDTLARSDPMRTCWTLWDAPPAVAFWRRRMTYEAVKHLWDLRTATEPDPPMPEEAGPEARAGVMAEFVELLVPAARHRGIEPLPRDVLLAADDAHLAWRFSREWHVTASVPSDADDAADADLLRAALGDLVLFVWERADPWRLPDRFRIDAGDSALRAFARTPVHL